MGKDKNISEKVIVSLLKSLITEESSGDTCKDKLGYNTIATANQIVQFQTWIWDEVEKNKKVTNKSENPKPGQEKYNSMLCSSPCTKRQAIDGHLGKEGSKTRIAWKNNGQKYKTTFNGTWCTEKKWATIWLNGVEAPVLSVNNVKSFQNYIFQTIEKFKIEAGKKYNSMLCRVKPCLYSEAVDGNWGDASSAAWETYGEKYKLSNPKWDDKDVTYDPKKPLDAVNPTELTVSNGCYYDKNSESWVDVSWLDWELKAFTSKSTGTIKPLNNFNQNTNQGITVSIPYKTEFGNSNVSYFYMKSKTTGVVSDFYITPDGYYRKYGGAYLGKEEPVVKSGGVNILDEIKKGNIPLPDGYFRKLDWNKSYDSQIIPNPNTGTSGIKVTRPSGLSQSETDYKIIDYKKNVSTQYKYVLGKKVEVPADVKTAWSYTPPATSVVQIDYKKNSSKITYDEWLGVYNSPGGVLVVKSEFNWRGYTENDLTDMGILPGPIETPKEVIMTQGPNLEKCRKITTFNREGQQIQIDEPECAQRNRLKQERHNSELQATGKVGKYSWWGRKSDDLQTMRNHFAVVMEDWNEDNGNYISSIFTDKDGNIKQGKELEEAYKKALGDANKFFTDEKNQYLLPEGISVEDGPKYFAEWQLLTDKYNSDLVKVKKEIRDYYMGQPVFDWGKANSLTLSYQLNVKNLINKYTTRIFGTEKMSKSEYENYLKDRGQVESYYAAMKLPYNEKLKVLSKRMKDENNINYRANVRDATYVENFYTKKSSLMKIDQINQYTSMIKHLDTELKTVISIVDRNYGIATSDKTKSKIASDPFKEIPKPEFLGIEVEKWHTILQTAALAAMIIPGLQGAGMALRGLSIIGAAETTLGGAIGFALSMVDAGIYINEENYMGAGIAFLFGMLGVKANWNILERGFHSLTDAVNVVMKEILMGSDAAGKEIVEMLAKKDDIIRKGITDYVNAVEKITNTSVEITEANLIKGTNLPWYTVSRVSEQGSTLVVRRAILEEYLYNVINISNRGINAALAGVSKDIPKFISGLVTFEGVIRGSEMLRDKLAPDADLCDLIENKLGRGDGACDLYKNVFGVETDEEKELLKKAILDFDWKPGMVIPKDYMTTESKKRLEESNRYQELLDIWGTTNTITKLEIPQETVKIVYEYVTETLPKEGTEEYNNIVNQESEETQKTILEKVKKQKELFDTDEEIDELIRQAQERVKKQKTPEKIEKSDFQNNEYFNDEIIDKYNFKKPSDLFN
jgi:hypothetical protein